MQQRPELRQEDLGMIEAEANPSSVEKWIGFTDEEKRQFLRSLLASDSCLAATTAA